MSKKAMKLALEALKITMGVWGGTCAWHSDVKIAIKALEEALANEDADAEIIKYHEATIARLQEALAKQEQRSVSEHTGEPVALTWNKKMLAVQAMLGITSGELDCLGESLLETYANDVERVYKALCTAPQQRTWVGLTDEEMKLIDPDGYEDGLPQQIQQALKEKNT